MGWNTWLNKNGDTVSKIDKELKERMDEFSTALTVPAPIDLRDWNGIPDHEGVTAPNIASLMLMVEENGKRLLLTGDSQQDFILAGLKKTGFLANGHLHLDVHKIQHHGSEHNLDEDFVRQLARHVAWKVRRTIEGWTIRWRRASFAWRGTAIIAQR